MILTILPCSVNAKSEYPICEYTIPASTANNFVKFLTIEFDDDANVKTAYFDPGFASLMNYDGDVGWINGTPVQYWIAYDFFNTEDEKNSRSFTSESLFYQYSKMSNILNIDEIGFYGGTESAQFVQIPGSSNVLYRYYAYNDSVSRPDLASNYIDLAFLKFNLGTGFNGFSCPDLLLYYYRNDCLFCNRSDISYPGQYVGFWSQIYYFMNADVGTDGYEDPGVISLSDPRDSGETFKIDIDSYDASNLVGTTTSGMTKSPYVLTTESDMNKVTVNEEGEVEFAFCNFYTDFKGELASIINKNGGSCNGKYSFAESYDTIINRCNNFRMSHTYSENEENENVKTCLKNCADLRDYVNDRCGFQSTDSCNSLGSKVMNWIYRAIKIVRYAVPALLIILSILDWIKAIASESDDEMKKVTTRFMKRLIAAALIFLIPFVLDFILRMFSIPGFNADNPFCTD